MKMFLYIAACMSLLVTVSSCKKYLEQKPSTTLTTASSLSDMQALLDDADGTMNIGHTPSFIETSADDYFCLPNLYAGLTTWSQQAYIWQPYDYKYPDDWSLCYAPVFVANFCLESVNGIARTNDNNISWDNVKGSALFFRAYYFLLLSWTFSKAHDEQTADKDLGIVLRLTSDYTQPSVRSSVRESYDLILRDVKEAATLLPDLPVHPYRPSKCAAYGLLARTYLSMRIYDSAYKYANQSLQIQNGLMDYNGDEEIGTITANYPFRRFNKETVFYTEMNSTATYSLLLASKARVDTVFMQSYEPGDLRKTAFFTKSGNYYLFKGSYSQRSLIFTGMTTAELLLIRAECTARISNDVSNALADLNSLLVKRYSATSFVPITISNKEDLINRILLERRKELFFRGLRWMDIKRLNKEGRNIVLKRMANGQIYTLEPNDAYYALPLPKDIIDITGMPQN